MSLISFSSIVDGTTASASQVNTPLSTIYNDYNGNITDANISASAAIAGSKINTSSLFTANNTKSAKTTSSKSLTNSVDTDLAANGATISFTVSGTAYALVTVDVGVSSTTDFEFQPEIFVDGSLSTKLTYAATLGGGASGRVVTRSYTAAITLSSGSHTISAGVQVVSATSPLVPSDSANIAAVVLGNVTA